MEQSYDEAARWFRAAAEQGNADAQYMFGLCYESGWGVDKSYDEAARWFRAAAEQGHACCQFKLGTCYESGRV
ncbi:MAG: sel1 repeat family protein [Candidatus Methanomethylophilaceae archaeon]|nr:sel1 repeat family protein [Candidatus Methanomethylophilaceae archaeon]